ncbi:MAG: 3-deoxy-8-phosphooctulonate synthase [Bacteroidia bacterium]
MKPLFLIAGPCAIEDRHTPLEIAREVKAIADRLGIPYIFKSSYKKANRTKLDSFTGISKPEALEILQQVREDVGVPVLTDVHETWECAEVAPYVDYLQIPAFLCRQTDLLLAAGETGKGINIKKGQFLSPEAMAFAVEKVRSTGNNHIWLTERGTTFGYESLVVDMTAIPRMQQTGCPVVMDCTHSVQRPNQTAGITGGDARMIGTLCLAAVAAGADGLFIETHPDPSRAKSDASSMLKLNLLEELLARAVKVRYVIDG